MAARTTVPVVLLGRYTTFAGAHTFTTLPIDVVPYESVELAVWRGDMISGGTFSLSLEGSMDRETWANILTSTPAADTETSINEFLTRSWLRVKLVVGANVGDFPVVSCFAVGQLIKRRV